MTRSQALAEIAALRERLAEAYEALGSPPRVVLLRPGGGPSLVISTAGQYEQAAVTKARADAGLVP